MIESNSCVDTSRVFATRGSNGGMFTWALSQNLASAMTFRAIAPLIGLPHRAYLDLPGKAPLPVLVITGTLDTTVPPGPWESTTYTTTSNGDTYYTGASAITRAWGAANSCPYVGLAAATFSSGTSQADCRTYCSSAAGWTGGAPSSGWPNVLDCRAAMGHTFSLSWSWKLVLDFFDAHSQ